MSITSGDRIIIKLLVPIFVFFTEVAKLRERDHHHLMLAKWIPLPQWILLPQWMLMPWIPCRMWVRHQRKRLTPMWVNVESLCWILDNMFLLFVFGIYTYVNLSMWFFVYTDIHICLYIYIYIYKQKLILHAVKKWHLFFDRCNQELLTLSVTMTCEDEISACPGSMQCKCSLYCMHADLCVCEFDFNLMWTFWITACGLDICLFLLRMFKHIFAQHVAVQFLLHKYAYMCVCWDKSDRVSEKKCSCACSEDSSCSWTILYKCTKNVKETRTQAHVTEFQFRMQFLLMFWQTVWYQPTKQTCF